MHSMYLFVCINYNVTFLLLCFFERLVLFATFSTHLTVDMHLMCLDKLTVKLISPAEYQKYTSESK